MFIEFSALCLPPEKLPSVSYAPFEETARPDVDNIPNNDALHAIKDRTELEIVFPRVGGYRRDLPSEKLEAAAFTADSVVALYLSDR
jgi:hypothetical protein